MDILTYTNLYPNNVDAVHGIFVERRLQMLLRTPGIRATVVAPVPWFPFTSPLFGHYAEMARITACEERAGVVVHHPRYPMIPKLGMNLAPWLMSAATRRGVERAIAQHGGVQLIDAHYFYPDGVAASRLARGLGLPYVITARGSDINLIAQYARPRALMLEAAAGAAALIAVSQALAQRMSAIGMPAEKIHVLRNGVDLDFFAPGEASGKGGGPSFLSVGVLKPAKGHDVAIRFVAGEPGASLVIAGSGPDETRLRRLAAELGVSARVLFAGRLDPEALRQHYRRADALILMSRREGMPNVILESLACGTPVLAADVGGIGEVVTTAAAGELVGGPDPDSLRAAWSRLRDGNIDPAAIRRHAERFSWQDTVSRLHRVMADSASGRTPEAGCSSQTSH